tara:strand:+ start:74 stop:454 length:381 start_codon:yes stop_codon:yes gene_type:complete
MSEIIHDSHVELENLSRRYLEAKSSLKEHEDNVELIRKDIIKILGGSPFVETKNHTIELREVPQNRMMGKEEFIRKYSPPMKDSNGNIMLNADEEPILETAVGTKFYQEHLVERVTKRFYVKKKKV